MAGTYYTLEVQPRLPTRLKGLAELANDLLYTWDRQVRGLFAHLDRELWESCGHNPKLFLRRVAQETLDSAAQDRTFMEDYHRALSVYNTYHREKIKWDANLALNPDSDLVAYFCAEFGLHESLPIYSGGLGILAGDHCKAASDLALPFIAIGMLYRQGYFNQTIDAHGNQIAHYTPTNFGDLPVIPCHVGGTELRVYVELPARRVALRVWAAKAGRITLYLLDSDLPENQEHDRVITYQLYGGNIETRIQQEMVLGIGGVRALRALGHTPSVWHLNEGHSAFQILERTRELVHQGYDFASALELVAAGTVFTTHTPVPAGHDMFDHAMVIHYFGEFAHELGLSMEQFLALGASASHASFNMTALALRGSRFHNGVSRIHGSVASRMESYIWPQIPLEENPVGYVTNGVHVPTFLAREWMNLFDMRLGSDWRNQLRNINYWQQIDDIPNHSYWSIRQTLKTELLAYAQHKAIRQHRRNNLSPPRIERLTRHLSPGNTDALIIGFARRFATYKRAALMFTDLPRLARLLNDPARPVMLIFAGKAHPKDVPGQHLIQQIHHIAHRPEFEGRIILLEGYDLALARKMVTGVDVWLNTPEFPLEASGTSGQKAGLNGVINLSVLDGWWGEGYDGDNGWAITPHGAHTDSAARDSEEARELLDFLEHDIIPRYFHRNGHGYSSEWVRLSKNSMKSILPRFNSQRMVMDYVTRYYAGANQQGRQLAANNGLGARELAAWKQRVRERWPGVKARRVDQSPAELKAGEPLPLRVTLELNGLEPNDVIVECILGAATDYGDFAPQHRYTLPPVGSDDDGAAIYALDIRPPLSGLQGYKLRAFPMHRLLTHRFETGLMIWL